MKMKKVVFLLILITLSYLSCKECPKCPDEAHSSIHPLHKKYHKHKKLIYTTIKSNYKFEESDIYKYNIDDSIYYSLGQIDSNYNKEQSSTIKYELYSFQGMIPKGVFNLKDTLRGNFIGIGFINDCPDNEVCTKLIGDRSCYIPNKGYFPKLENRQIANSLEIDRLVPILMNYHSNQKAEIEYWKLSEAEYEAVYLLSQTVQIGIGSDKKPYQKNYANIGNLNIHDNNDLFIVINPPHPNN